ncbi:MAG: glucokinase [Pseudomonadota bacterium]|jgi:glucokinase
MWAGASQLHDVRVLPCANYPSLQAAIEDYMRQVPGPKVTEAAIAMANPVTGDWVQMTNHHWGFSISQMQTGLGLHRLKVMNDFTALALALPTLTPDEFWQLGGRPVQTVSLSAAPQPIGLIGPGTGLGVSGLLPDGHGGWIPLCGEGGHVSLPAHTPREQAVVALLWERFGHASAERAVSGQGLSNLHAALTRLDEGFWPEALLPADTITRLALASPADARCAEVLDLFARFLGSIAGNLALSLGALGGVYIGGGIVPRLGHWLADSPFRDRFEAKGRFKDYLADIPVWVITAEVSPALRGAAQALNQSQAAS